MWPWNRAWTRPIFCDRLIAGGLIAIPTINTSQNYTSLTYLLTSDRFPTTVSHNPCLLIMDSANFDTKNINFNHGIIANRPAMLFLQDVRREHVHCAVMGAVCIMGWAGGAVCKSQPINWRQLPNDPMIDPRLGSLQPYLEIWWMTLKSYRTPLLHYIKLCASSQTPASNSNWSYCPETPNSGQNRRLRFKA